MKESNVRAFTETSNLAGTEETGAVFNSFEWPGAKSMTLTAVEEEDTERVIEGLKAFRDRLVQWQHGAKIPFRVFTLPCEQMICGLNVPVTAVR